MVSSTFYDLRDIRASLAEFISGMGYVPMLSELPAFPIDPTSDTVKNCVSRVQQHADIFVLVVGGRYGSVSPEADKSITNLEYLAAKAKGIPLYAFVHADVIRCLPLWQDNPKADFRQTVDTPRLLEFVSSVRSHEKTWTFEFTNGTDIVAALRAQFANLFGDTLALRLKLAALPDGDLIKTLSAEAARLVLERPPHWESLLFFQAWCDANERRIARYRLHKATVSYGKLELVPAPQAMEWLQAKMHELIGIIPTANHLIGPALVEARGPDGVPGDPAKLVWVAEEFGKLLEFAIDWSASVRQARVVKPFDAVATELAPYADSMIDELYAFPRKWLDQLKVDVREVSPTNPIRREATLVFTHNNLQGLLDSLERARQSYER